MIKILNTNCQDMSSGPSFNARAASAVKKILATRPAGLNALSSELQKYSQLDENLQLFRKNHRRFFVVGIGGSSLGVQVLADVFQVQNFEFIDNVDAAHFENILNNLQEPEKVGWLIISKSGNTIETLAALDFIHQYLNQKAIDISKHSIVITEKKESDLYNWSQRQKTLYYEVPVSVGGRFSVLSSVGLVPAVLMGLDIAQIAKGAEQAYENETALTSLTAEVLKSFARDEWVTVLWSYSSRLKSFGFWWQQLWAESLAKKVDLQGRPAPRASTPLPLVGATDQHSALQQVMEGAHDKLVCFLRVGDAEAGQIKLQKSTLNETSLLQGRDLGALLKAEAEAIQQALTETGISNLSLQIENLNAENLGYLIMFFQLLVIAMGESLGINTFNQPGVELGKIKAKAILAQGAGRI
jgi:glucose-6-phosphate isomerase